MIRVLLLESDPRMRDIIEVGLANFQDFEVHTADYTSAASLARENPFPLVLADLPFGEPASGAEESQTVLRDLRREHPDTVIILLTRGKAPKSLAKDRAELDLFATITLPLDELHFFKTVARARDRILLRREREQDAESEAEAED